MKVTAACVGRELRFALFPTEQEGMDVFGKASMGARACSFWLPDNWSLADVHPDVLALTALLIVYPFAREVIHVPLGVSQTFHEQVKSAAGIDVLPIDANLQPRAPITQGKPAIAFSGGVDSTAALAVLPDTACCVFLDRVQQSGKPTLYKKEAAYHACDSVAALGREVIRVRTDLEDVRSPIGFPVEYSTTIPALLLSDVQGFGSIATGKTLDYTFSPDEVARRFYGVQWERLFEAAGLPLNEAVSGLTEVGTSMIVLRTPYRAFAQSCMRGGVHKPCMNCYKCFRKLLLAKTIMGEAVADEELDRLFRIREARRYLIQQPVHGEEVLAYITSRYRGNHSLMNKLKAKTRGDVSDMAWMERWHRPSRERIAEPHRGSVERHILSVTQAMTAEDEAAMRQFLLAYTLKDPSYGKAHERFRKELEQ